MEQRKLGWGEGLQVVLRHGSLTEMANVFEIAESYGRSTKNDLVCMSGYMIGSTLRLIRPFSEGWYCLSPRGEARKQRSDI